MILQGHKGSYELGQHLGRGGFGDVHRAQSVSDKSLFVAIKMPLPGLPPEIAALYVREVNAAQRVDSPFVLKVLDWGDAPPFIALELVTDPVLREELTMRQRENRQWTQSELVDRFTQLCHGLEAINGQLIHRDVKPENIFIAVNGFKISDFGLAKFVGEATRSLTFKGGGTTAYMAPETFRAESASWHSDQYSLGVVFYEMATLQRPFDGDPAELERQHLFRVPPRVTDARAELSPALATVIARMLEKEATNRFQSWTEVLAALAAVKAPRVDQQEQPQNQTVTQLAREVAAQVDAKRSAELSAKEAAQARALRSQHRRDLLQYWSDKLFTAAELQVKAINATLNSDQLRMSGRPLVGDGAQASFSITFLDKTAEIRLFPFAIDERQGFTLWGYGKALTFGPRWATNFLVEEEPRPYGKFRSFDLRHNPWVPDDGRSDYEGDGARYERAVGSYALAINSRAVLAQLDRTNGMTLLQWEEGPSDLHVLMAQPIEALAKGAAAEPPQPQQRPPRRRRPFDGMV